MPSGPDARRLVSYVPAAQAEEIARRARLDGRTVSGWLARLIADVLDGPTPAETRAPDETLPPTVQPPPAGDAGGEGPAHEPALPSRRAREDPEYAAWLRSRGEGSQWS